MLQLRKLSLAGPPSTREDRAARQTMANSLDLAHAIYNALVFGETPMAPGNVTAPDDKPAPGNVVPDVEPPIALPPPNPPH